MLNIDRSELHLLLRQFADADREIRSGVAQESRRFAAILVRSAQARARGEVEKRIAQSAQTRVSAKGFVASFGRTGRLSGGAKLGVVTRPYEFGTKNSEAYQEYRSRHRTSRKYMRVERRTKKQIPAWNADGRFLYPALADVAPRLVGAYVRVIREAVSNA